MDRHKADAAQQATWRSSGKRPPRPQWHLLGPTIWAPWRDLPDNFGPYANSITPTCGPFGGSGMSCRTILGDWGGHQEGALLRLRGALPARGGPVYGSLTGCLWGTGGLRFLPARAISSIPTENR